MTEAPEVLSSVEGRVARLRLNRPKAIHALNLRMCGLMTDALVDWAGGEDVSLVLIDHAEGRGFCAGGDVVTLARSGAGDGQAARDFFAAEYRLNHLLFTYPIPTIAFMDGITMGGGVGISRPCRVRIATERTVFAMPETGIGLFPDVGGGRYLSRLPQRIGQYLGLTGARLSGAECVALGIATHYVPSDRLEELKAALIATPEGIEPALSRFAEPAPEAPIMAHAAQIERLFASDRLEDVLAALEADGGEWAAKQRAILAAKSPLSCKVTLRLLAEGAAIDDFADEMALEYALASRVARTHDFIDGVRALLIDKTNDPRWDPATPEGVGDAMVDALFAPLPPADRWHPIDLRGNA